MRGVSNACFFISNPELPKFTTKLSSLEHYGEPGFLNNSQAKGWLIRLRDLFAECWTPFLGYHFNQVTTCRQCDLDPAWIEQNKPVIVVTEMLERFFNIEDPKK